MVRQLEVNKEPAIYFFSPYFGVILLQNIFND